MKRLIWSTTAALALAVPMAASAADGYVTGNVTLRAGPDIGYPYITTIPAGTEVSIQGCTDGWEWCDVIAYDSRGWVAGDYIQYDYDNERVYVPEYGARIGIPIISFSINTYWDNYYRNRPFYRQRTSWYHRAMPHHAPPRPSHYTPPPRVVPMPHPIYNQHYRAADKPTPRISRMGETNDRPANNPAPRPQVQPHRNGGDYTPPPGNMHRTPEQGRPANDRKDQHDSGSDKRDDKPNDKRDRDKDNQHDHN